MSDNTAQIIASYGRHFTIRTAQWRCYDATARAKRNDYVCGDWVNIRCLNDTQAVIETLVPRQSLLYRQDAWRSKLIAANVDQVLIVIAAVPTPSEMVLQRALLAAEAAHIRATIVLNKADLPQTAVWQEKLMFYADLGYPVVAVSAHEDCAPLRPILHGRTNIFLGQSGMGKSTLTNALLGENVARTNGISAALNSGKHTTTHAQLYDVDQHTHVIDSPGLQEFGLNHLDVAHLLDYFPDFRAFIGQCRFHNCTHRAEPNCALKQAAERGDVCLDRLLFLQKLTDELVR